MGKKNIFSDVPFGKLGDINVHLDYLRENLLLAGNLQSPDDEEYWKHASDHFKCILNLMQEQVVEYYCEKEKENRE